MKKSAIFLFALFFAYGIQAQTLKVPTKSDAGKAQESIKGETTKAVGQANIGSLIGDLTNNISDEALTDSFRKNKSSFISNLGKINDVAGASSALQALQGGLLPTAMEAGWSKVKEKWISDAKTAHSIKSVAAAASTLESNIGDRFFKPNWAKARPAWQASLNALSK